MALLSVGLGVQILTIREIWLHPNSSRSVSVVVIAFVVTAYVVIFVLASLKYGFQPVQTLEDYHKLEKLAWKDKKQYDAILKEMAEQHVKRGF